MSGPNGKVNRFIVFRAVQAFMNQWNRCPQPFEVAEITGLHKAKCAHHMHALDGVTGLKFPIEYEYRGFSTRGYIAGGMGSNLDPYTSPVDRLMA